MKEGNTRIGFVSTRFAGTDGVSLKTAQWEKLLSELGHNCQFFAGELDRPEERSRLVPDPQQAEEMCEHNYELGRTYYSFETLRDYLNVMLNQAAAVRSVS